MDNQISVDTADQQEIVVVQRAPLSGRLDWLPASLLAVVIGSPIYIPLASWHITTTQTALGKCLEDSHGPAHCG